MKHDYDSVLDSGFTHVSVNVFLYGDQTVPESLKSHSDSTKGRDGPGC